MQEYKIILTWEAIYDVTDIADYIEEEFGQQHADRFQSDLKEQMQNSVSYTHLTLPTSDLVKISVDPGSLKKKKKRKTHQVTQLETKAAKKNVCNCTIRKNTHNRDTHTSVFTINT